MYTTLLSSHIYTVPPAQYTWDKKMETWVKSSGMLGGNGKVREGMKT